ncbi:hypothetical protein Ocin01_00864 [Orchesella cincta]|uniref:Uncharacterized protein n=1 Tax=Orchesella cincta TaxID=48709 RepID=A0A1D2NL68_ORCCI|nr:hypothetical protein Ocin01_00864 [Orchesella cincta]
MTRLKHLTLVSFVIIVLISFFHTCSSQRPLDANDVYTFCASGRARGDIAMCKGYCADSNTRCSSETGVCGCTTTKLISNANANFSCRPAPSRTRCSNACKTFAAIETFRRGDSRICTSKSDTRIMCFCMPRPK